VISLNWGATVPWGHDCDLFERHLAGRHQRQEARKPHLTLAQSYALPNHRCVCRAGCAEEGIPHRRGGPGTPPPRPASTDAHLSRCARRQRPPLPPPPRAAGAPRRAARSHTTRRRALLFPVRPCFVPPLAPVRYLSLPFPCPFLFSPPYAPLQRPRPSAGRRPCGRSQLRRQPRRVRANHEPAQAAGS